MKKNKIVIDLDVNLNHIKNITLKQYNQYSQWIVVRITENGKPFFIDDKDICIFKMCTPDKREIYNDCVFVDNCIVVEITQNCCTNSGTGIAELNIIDEEKEAQIASFNFNIVIEKSAYDNESIEGSNEYKSLADRIIAADKAIENAEIATDNANTAADNADAATKDLQDKLDSHHFVLTEDKDVANGVPSLDENVKVPIIELYEATTTQKGITQLTDSVTSTSNTTAATPNSVKMVNDSIIAECERAIESEEILESKKADISSPTFTGIPKAPTASVGTNTTQIATTEFVQTSVSNGIAASDAMIIKGTIGSNTETGMQGTINVLPTTYKTGWTYRVVADGTYAGQICEIGDLIIALVDRNGSNNADSDWCVAQTNINGAITGVKSGDAYVECSQSGSAVTIKHKDISRTNVTSTISPSIGGNFTAIKSITSDIKGHVTAVNTETVTLPPGTLTEFLTQAEYDSLSQSVQENGTIYFITDSDAAVDPGENDYLIPVASPDTLGGVKTGYIQNDRNFPVQLDEERMYVNVPESEGGSGEQIEEIQEKVIENTENISNILIKQQELSREVAGVAADVANAKVDIANIGEIELVDTVAASLLRSSYGFQLNITNLPENSFLFGYVTLKYGGGRMQPAWISLFNREESNRNSLGMSPCTICAGMISQYIRIPIALSTDANVTNAIIALEYQTDATGITNENLGLSVTDVQLRRYKKGGPNAN